MLVVFTLGLIMLIVGFSILKENTGIGLALIIFGGAFLNLVASVGY